MNTPMKILYRYRGVVLVILGAVLFAFPPGSLEALPIALPLFTLSLLLRVWARSHIGSHTRGSTHEADYLVTSGPYRWMRHPLYVSNTGFAFSLVLFHLGLTWMALPFMLAVVAFEILLDQAENVFLKKKFGEEWDGWKNLEPNPYRISLFKAFCNDVSTWWWLLFCNLILLVLKLVVGKIP